MSHWKKKKCCRFKSYKPVARLKDTKHTQTHTFSHDSWCICLMTGAASVSALTGTMCFDRGQQSLLCYYTHTVLLSHTWWFQIRLIYKIWPLFTLFVAPVGLMLTLKIAVIRKQCCHDKKKKAKNRALFDSPASLLWDSSWWSLWCKCG